jgi:hypothetical protein
MTYEVQCACGAVLRAATGDQLLEAVERHAVDVHPEPTWRRGPTLSELRQQVVALGARVALLEQREAAT